MLCKPCVDSSWRSTRSEVSSITNDRVCCLERSRHSLRTAFLPTLERPYFSQRERSSLNGRASKSGSSGMLVAVTSVLERRNDRLDGGIILQLLLLSSVNS